MGKRSDKNRRTRLNAFKVWIDSLANKPTEEMQKRLLVAFSAGWLAKREASIHTGDF